MGAAAPDIEQRMARHPTQDFRRKRIYVGLMHDRFRLHQIVDKVMNGLAAFISRRQKIVADSQALFFERVLH